MKKQKTKTTHKKPVHLHIEHISRAPIILAAVVGLFMVAMLKSDSRILGTAREAYAEQVGRVSSYMRQETVHNLATFSTARTPTISGQ